MGRPAVETSKESLRGDESTGEQRTSTWIRRNSKDTTVLIGDHLRKLCYFPGTGISVSTFTSNDKSFPFSFLNTTMAPASSSLPIYASMAVKIFA